MNANISQELLNGLAVDADVFPHQYNYVADQILLVRLPAQVQKEASFLDERVLTPQTQGAWFNADVIEQAAANVPAKPVGYIFHAGHCGSTLASRLIGAATAALSLREPLPLRAFAFDGAEGSGAMLGAQKRRDRIALFEKLWARDGASAVVKATSICTELANGFAPAGTGKAIFISQEPETHIAVLLAGRNSINDLRGFAQLRWRKLSAHALLPPLSGYGPGELAALAWLAESAAAHRACIAAYDFDDLLAKSAGTLKSMISSLDLETDENCVAKAIEGPIMRQYSKAPEHAYDANLRGRIIAESRQAHGEEIRKGMKWLENLARQHAPAADVLSRWTRN